MLFTTRDLRTVRDKKADITLKFLEECEKVGIKVVAIGTRSSLIPPSITWTTDPSDSVFALERYDGWPAIWEPAKRLKIMLCGNYGQAQVKDGYLNRGIYRLREDGWYKICSSEET